MNQLILHHYPTSPFAEKVRAMLGYKGLAWTSVYAPMIMPKPHMQALTGGYRRIPILQIGADIYCDSALIADVLEHLSPEKTFYPEHAKGVSRVIAQWADTQLFWTAMAYNFQPAALANIFPNAPPETVKAFAEDRQQMRAGMPRMHPADAAGAYKSYLRRIATMVQEQPFITGSAPSIADFACYHSLWFTQTRSKLDAIFDATPAVKAWLQRMSAFTQAPAAKMTDVQALELAAASTPDPLGDEPFQNEHGIALGTPVMITADNFGLEVTTGELVAATRTRYTLRRTDAQAGTVHVHFPRVGFQLRAEKKV
jgi:glutathione S-transferase